MSDYLVDLDDRHRTSLGKVGRPGKYRVRETAEGQIILDPVRIVTDAQVEYDSRADIQAALRDSGDRFERKRPARRAA